MGVPSAQFGDFLVADRAVAILFPPAVQQSSSTFQALLHFETYPFLEIGFQLGVEGVGFSSNLGMPLYWGITRLD